MIGLAVAARTLSFVQRSVSVQATVVDVEIRRDASEAKVKYQFYPVLEFSDAKGLPHRFRGGLSKSASGTDVQHAGWERGETVAIRYDPRNPEDARMSGFWTWGFPTIFTGLGALAVLVSFRIAADASRFRRPA